MNDAIVGRPSSSRTSSDDIHRRLAREKNVDLAAEAQILRSLADIEADPRLALAGVAAINLHDAILEAQSGKGPLERPVIEHDHIGPALNDVGGANRCLRFGATGRLPVHRGGVGAFRDELGRDARPGCGPSPGRPTSHSESAEAAAGPCVDLTRLSALISIPIKQ